MKTKTAKILLLTTSFLTLQCQGIAISFAAGIPVAPPLVDDNLDENGIPFAPMLLDDNNVPIAPPLEGVVPVAPPLVNADGIPFAPPLEGVVPAPAAPAMAQVPLHARFPLLFDVPNPVPQNLGEAAAPAGGGAAHAALFAQIRDGRPVLRNAADRAAAGVQAAPAAARPRDLGADLRAAVRNRAGAAAAAAPVQAPAGAPVVLPDVWIALAATEGVVLTDAQKRYIRNAPPLKERLDAGQNLTREENKVVMEEKMLVSKIKQAKLDRTQGLVRQNAQRVAEAIAARQADPVAEAAWRARAAAAAAAAHNKAMAHVITLRSAREHLRGNRIDNLHGELVNAGKDQIGTRAGGVRPEVPIVSPQLLRKLVMNNIVPKGFEMFESSAQIKDYQRKEEKQLVEFVRETITDASQLRELQKLVKDVNEGKKLDKIVDCLTPPMVAEPAGPVNIAGLPDNGALLAQIRGARTEAEEQAAQHRRMAAIAALENRRNGVALAPAGGPAQAAAVAPAPAGGPALGAAIAPAPVAPVRVPAVMGDRAEAVQALNAMLQVRRPAANAAAQAPVTIESAKKDMHRVYDNMAAQGMGQYQDLPQAQWNPNPPCMTLRTFTSLIDNGILPNPLELYDIEVRPAVKLVSNKLSQIKKAKLKDFIARQVVDEASGERMIAFIQILGREDKALGQELIESLDAEEIDLLRQVEIFAGATAEEAQARALERTTQAEALKNRFNTALAAIREGRVMVNAGAAPRENNGQEDAQAEDAQNDAQQEQDDQNTARESVSESESDTSSSNTVNNQDRARDNNPDSKSELILKARLKEDILREFTKQSIAAVQADPNRTEETLQKLEEYDIKLPQTANAHEDAVSKGLSVTEQAAAYLAAQQQLDIAQIANQKEKLLQQGSLSQTVEVNYMVANVINDRINAAGGGMSPGYKIAAGVATGVAAGEEEQANPNKRVWISGFYGTGRQGARLKNSGYNSHTGGFTIGADINLSENEANLIGLAYSNVHSSFKMKQARQGDRSGVVSHVFSIYGQAEIFDKLLLQATASKNSSRVTNKSIKLVGPGNYKTATGKFNSKGYSFNSSLSYRFDRGNLALIPNIGIKYGKTYDGFYTESGTGVYNLSVASKLGSSLSGVIGIKAILTKNIRDNLLIAPMFHASIENVLKSNNQNAKVRLVWADKTFDSETGAQKPEKWGYNIGAGLMARYNNIELSSMYNCHLRKKYIGHQGSLKVEVKF